MPYSQFVHSARLKLSWLAVVATLFVSTASSQTVMTTFAGTDFVFPGDGKAAVTAPIGFTYGMAANAKGEIFFSAPAQSLVMKVGTDGVIHVVAGNGIRSYSGDDGPAANASVAFPLGVATDSAGNLYVADYENHVVRKVRADGTVTTFAGNSEGGFSGDGGAAVGASLFGPAGLAMDGAGNLFIADSINNRVRRVTPAGVITTVAGSGEAGFSGDGGRAMDAKLNFPQGVAVDAGGSLYIADTLNHRIRRVSANGTIDTAAGNGDRATLSSPRALAIDSSGSLYVADTQNHRLRKITGGAATTVAGTGRGAFAGDGGPAAAASLNTPSGVAIDGAGNIYVADYSNLRIRRIAAGGSIGTVAGNGLARYSGDGGPAVSAVLDTPQGVSIDRGGSVYIADSVNNRIRKVTPDGRITTFAGNGAATFAGDGGAAVSASLNLPEGKMPIDASGAVYICDRGNNRIRKVDASGIIGTVAGTGQAGFSGDGQAATGAMLDEPADITLDAAGNLYIADRNNHRIRKVTPSGIISTIAGTGKADFSGDGGAAVSASLNTPYCVTFDANGNLYVCDSGNRRVRRIGADGVIRTVAGSGDFGFSEDQSAATLAAVDAPYDVAVDRTGNLYIAAYFSSRVLRVSPDGILSTIAGTGEKAFFGDGNPPTSAGLNLPFGLALDATGNLYISDSGNSRIRVVLTAAPPFSVSTEALSFSATADGTPSEQQSVTLSSILPGASFKAEPGTSWLRANPAQGAIPAVVKISCDPAGLAPGDYDGAVRITAPGASPPVRIVNVHFQVSGSVPPQLFVGSNGLSFFLPAGASPASREIAVENHGGGRLAITASVNPAGSGWLSVSPPQSLVTPNAPASVTVNVDPSRLSAGTYSARVSVSSPGGPSIDAPVTLAVSGARQNMQLSQSGLLFTAVVGGGTVAPGNFGVVNAGQGVMPWSVQTRVLANVPNWLLVTPASGSSDSSGAVPRVQVQAKPAGLAPGIYYGEIQVSSDTAANAPQTVTAVLDLRPAGSNPGPVVQPSGLIFIGVAGAASPGAQAMQIYNPSAAPLSFGSGRATLDGKAWFVYQPTDAFVQPDQPTRILVQPSLAGLETGVRRGVVTMIFSDGSIRNVGVILVVAPGQSSKGAKTRRADGSCTPSKLLPIFTTLADQFSSSASWPIPLEVAVVDDCGAPMVSGSVVATFSNGDPALSMTPLNDGHWAGTWKARNLRGTQTTVTVSASRGPQIAGSISITGGLSATANPPQLDSDGVVNSVSQDARAPLAPGGLVSILGRKLADAPNQSQAGAWDTRLGASSVLLGGRLLPLESASDGRINAIVPYDVPVNSQLQLIVTNGLAGSTPESLLVAPAQPAIFTVDSSGSGQGQIFAVSSDGASTLAAPSNPAAAGSTILIRCAGLGTVSPPIVAGAAAPESAIYTTVATVTVSIGDFPAEVVSTTLTPGAIGRYDVKVKVPDGVTPGDAVPVLVTVSGRSSPPVTMAVH